MIIEQLKEANIAALKAHDSDARSVLSVVLNKIKLAEIEKRTEGVEMTDVDVTAVLIKAVKELTEERDAFDKAGRAESVATLNKQIAFVSTFLPKMMDKAEILAEINKLDDKSIPAVMKHFKANFAGKCDMRDVQSVLKEM